MKKNISSTNSSFPQDVSDPRLIKVRAIFKKLSFKGERLLDVGCYDGTFTFSLREFADELYGIDINEKALTFAQEKEIRTFKVDVNKERVPFKDNFFDIVFCGELIEHLFRPDHLLDEIWRVLKPKGKLVIATPNLGSYANRLVLLLGFQPYLTSTGLKYDTGKLFSKRDVSSFEHLRLFTHKAMKELLELHGFKVEKSFGSGASQMVYSLSFSLKFIDKMFSKIPQLAIYLIFVAEKK